MPDAETLTPPHPAFCLFVCEVEPLRRKVGIVHGVQLIGGLAGQRPKQADDINLRFLQNLFDYRALFEKLAQNIQLFCKVTVICNHCTNPFLVNVGKKNFRSQRRAMKINFSLIPGADTGNQRGIPDSAESGQPARLERAGSQTRTRLSPAGGIAYNRALMANQMTGTASDGSILSVLQSRILSMDRPDAAMRIPPMMDTSVIRASVRNPDNAPAHR